MVGDSNPKIIHLDRLTMEPLQLFDLDSLAAIWSDPEVTKFLPSRGVAIPREKVEKALASFIEHWQKLGYGIWKILEDETDKMVGYCGLRYLEELNEVELLYGLAKEYWGSGNCGLGVSPSRANFQDKELLQKQRKLLFYSVLMKPI